MDLSWLSAPYPLSLIHISTISLRECAEERFVLPADNLHFSRAYDELLSQVSVTPNVVCRTDDSQCAKRICASCSLVMLCPFITLLSDTPAMQQLAHYRLSDTSFTPLYICLLYTSRCV